MKTIKRIILLFSIIMLTSKVNIMAAESDTSGSSILLSGPEFNSAIISLLPDNDPNSVSDIIWVDSLWDSDSDPASVSLTGTPVYARYNDTYESPVIELYSEATTVYLHKDSSSMLKGLTNLNSASFLSNPKMNFSAVEDHTDIFEGCENLDVTTLNLLFNEDESDLKESGLDSDNLELLTPQTLKKEIRNYQITASGNMPEEAYLSVREVYNYADLKEQIGNEDFSVSAAFDIEILINDEPWQPMFEGETIEVSITPKTEDVFENIEEESIAVYRILDRNDVEEIKEETGAADVEAVQKIDAKVLENGSVMFDSDHFTIYTVGSISINIDDSNSVIIQPNNFNTKIKTLANGTSITNTGVVDNVVTFMEWSTTPFTSSTNISESRLPLYARIVTRNGKKGVQFYTEATTIYLVTDPGTATGCYMFQAYNALELCPFIENPKINISHLGTLSYMFSGCSNLTSLNLSGWDVSNITSLDHLFNNCQKLTTVGDLSTWNTSNVTSFFCLFNNCYKLTSVGDLSNWNTSQVTNMRGLFWKCQELTSIGDLSNWNISNVTDTSYMFGNCNKLTTVGNLSSWNVSKVTDMNYMFSDCHKLEFVGDLSNWQTVNVLNMSYMFANCYVLSTTGNLSRWNTPKVTNMGVMFQNCKKITLLNLSNWNVSEVTDMSYMFSGCENLESVGDLSNWNTSKVTTMKYMFPKCCKLISVGDLSEWETLNVTSMCGMFQNCDSLTSLNLSGWDTSKVTDMRYMFCNCFDCSELNSLDISGFDMSNVTMAKNMFEDTNISSLKLFKTDSFSAEGSVLFPYIFYLDDDYNNIPDSATEYSTFIRGESVSHHYIKCFKVKFMNDEELIDTEYIYVNSNAIEPETPNVIWQVKNSATKYSHTSNITDEGERFGQYKNRQSVTDTIKIPGATSLHIKITYGTEANSDYVYVFSGVYNNTLSANMSAGQLKTYQGGADTTTTDEFDVTGDTVTFGFYSDTNTAYYGYYAEITGVGTTEAEDQYVDFDFTQPITKPITLYAKTQSSGLTTHVLDYNTFGNLSVDINDSTDSIIETNKFNTDVKTLAKGSAVTTPNAADNIITFMDWSATPFSDGIDISVGGIPIYARIATKNDKTGIEFYTTASNIYLVNSHKSQPYSNSMFKNLNALETCSFIEDTRIDTSKMETLSTMFYLCSKLKSLNLSNFNVSKCDSLYLAFGDCSELESITGISDWDTSQVLTFTQAFTHCSKLTSLDLSKWNTSNAISTSNMFNYCTLLASVGNLSTKVINEGAENEYIAWDTSKITDMSSMFGGSGSANTKNTALTSLNLSGWNTSKVQDMSSMFCNCTALTSIEGISDWNTSSVTNIRYMFAGYNASCGITSLDLSRWNTSKIKDMTKVFYWSKLTTAGDISNWNTSNVTTMEALFDGCKNETTLHCIEGWNTSSLTNLNRTFYGCNLNGYNVDLSHWDTSKVTNMSYCFAGFSTINESVKNWNTTSVTNMSSIFQNSSLNNVDLSHWDTSNVKDMSYVFSSASNIDFEGIKGWNTSNVTNMKSMFQSASSLTSIDISNFDMTKVTNATYMLSGCSKLKRIVSPKTIPSAISVDLPSVSGKSWYLDDDNNLITDSNEPKTVFLNNTIDTPHIYIRNDIEGFSYMHSPSILKPGADINAAFKTLCPNVESIYPFAVMPSDLSASVNIAIDGCDPVYATHKSFSDGVRYTKFDHTENIDDNGINNGNYDNNLSYNHSITIDGAEGLHISLKYATENGQDQIYVLNGTYTGNVTRNMSPSGYTRKYSGDIGANEYIRFEGNSSSPATIELNVTGDTVTFAFYSNGYTSYYGYYAQIGENKILPAEECIEISYDTRMVTPTLNPDSSEMFKGLSELTSVDLSFADATGVTNASDMFTDCSNLNLITSPYTIPSEVNIPLLTTATFNWALDDAEPYGEADDDQTYTNMINGTMKQVHKYTSVPTALKAYLVSGPEFNVALKQLVDPDAYNANSYNHVIGTPDANLTGFGEFEITNIKWVDTPWANVESSVNVATNEGIPVYAHLTTEEGGDTIVELYTSATKVYFNPDCQHMFSGFFGITGNLDMLDPRIDTSNVTNMKCMFSNRYTYGNYTNLWTSLIPSDSGFGSLDVSMFDTSNVTSFEYTFDYQKRLTSLDVSDFDTSNATTVCYMFNSCINLESLDVDEWDTSNIVNMSYLFNYCSSLSSLDLSNWNNSRAQIMTCMFQYCQGLTSLDLSNFTTSKVQNIEYLFSNCSALQTLDVSSFNTSNVTVMSNVFYNCTNLTVINGLSGWDTSKVTTMQSMFYGCNKLTILESLSGWDTSKVTTMRSMFYDCRVLTSIGDISDWDVSRVANTSTMFYCCYELASVGNLLNWNTSSVTDMSSMFYYCKKLTGINPSKWNTFRVTNMQRMFYGCGRLTSLDLSTKTVNPGTAGTYSAWNVAACQNFAEMFEYCEGLVSLNVSGWNVSGANNTLVYGDVGLYLTGLNNIFDGCKNLENINISGWDTTGVRNFRGVFSGCKKLTEIDISGWDITAEGAAVDGLFGSCSSLREVWMPDYIPAYTSKPTNPVTYVPQKAFYSCDNLSVIHGLKDVTEIPQGCYQTTKINDKNRYLSFVDYEDFISDCWLNYDWDTDNRSAYIYTVSVPVSVAASEEFEIGVKSYIEKKDIDLTTGSFITLVHETDSTKFATLVLKQDDTESNLSTLADNLNLYDLSQTEDNISYTAPVKGRDRENNDGAYRYLEIYDVNLLRNKSENLGVGTYSGTMNISFSVDLSDN